MTRSADLTGNRSARSTGPLHSNSSDQGIAIVSVLLVLMALTAFGLSAIYLTQMNLGIAGNARSSTTADNNAASGLNAAFAALQRSLDDDGEFPLALNLPSITGNNFTPTYTLAAYERRNATTAYVAVTGTAPGQAEYLSEALVAVAPGGTTLPPYFAYGLSTEGTFRANGSAAYVSAGIHANKGFTLNGSQDFYVCTERWENGDCATTVLVPPESLAVTASPGATTCSVNPATWKDAICDGNRPRHLTDPVAIVPDTEARRDEAMERISQGTEQSPYFGIYCDLRYTTRPNPTSNIFSAIAALPPNSTVCLDYSQSTSFNGTYSLSAVNLVARGDFSFNGTLTTEDVMFISYDGTFSVNGGGHTFTNTSIYTDGNLTMNGSNNYIGYTTLVSGGNLTTNGSYDATIGVDGRVEVGIAMVAEGNITINGSSQMYIAAVAGGTFTKNGSAYYRGRIASAGNMTFNGGFDIDAGLAISNPELSEPGSGGLMVVSQR